MLHRPPRSAALLAGLIALTLMGAPISAKAHEPAGGDAPPIGEAVKDLPLFDAHIHYKHPAWEVFRPKKVLELMDKSGVAMGLVSSTPDEGTIKLWQYAPARFVPELRPYKGSIGAYNWTKAEGMFDYIHGRLERYPHKGIGEFHMHRWDPDDEPLMRKIAHEAVKRDIYIHIHSLAYPVERLFAMEPKLKIIWAHAGMSEPPHVVEKMMARYDRLYADTSYREDDILSGGGLDPAWRKVLMRFPERFMVGSDTWINGQWADYEGLIANNRKWLRHLPRREAEMIAYRNAERLFGRKVSKSLIGKR